MKNLDILYLDQKQLEEVYMWLDEIPLSKPKKVIQRDFSDGVLLAEVVKFYHPQLVDLSIFPCTKNFESKKQNWENLNRLIFQKMGDKLKPHQIEKLIKHDFPSDQNEHYIEKFLYLLKPILENFIYENPLKKSNIYSRYLISQLNTNQPLDQVLENQKSIQQKQVKNLQKKSVKITQQKQSVYFEDKLPKVKNLQSIMNKKKQLNVLQENRGVNNHKDPKFQELIKLKDKQIENLYQAISMQNQKIIKLQELVNIKDEQIKQLSNNQLTQYWICKIIIQ